MDLVTTVLVLLIAIEFITIGLFVSKILKKKQAKEERYRETAKMLPKIMLSNEADNIDDMIGILIKDNVHINFTLR